MGEVRTVLDQNLPALRHLCLGAYLKRYHTWDSAFQSVTIKNLTHLDLVDTRISHIVLSRIAHAHNLQSLTLHGTFEDPGSAGVIFGSDHIIDGQHTFLPRLEAFRFVLVGHDDQLSLFQAVVRLLRGRQRLRRLDLGNCPWELVLGVLADLTGLRVLRVRVPNLGQVALKSLVAAIPDEMVAIHLATIVSDRSLVYFTSFQHLLTHSILCRTSTRRHLHNFWPCRSSTSMALLSADHSRISCLKKKHNCKPSFGTRMHAVLLPRFPRLILSDGTANITLSFEQDTESTMGWWN